MNNKQHLVSLQNIDKNFIDGENTLKVLKGITIQLGFGEKIAITGRSGCGKSTLLHIIGLLDKQTGGEYRFIDRDTLELSETEKNKIRNVDIGFVFQHFHLIKELSVIENVLLPSLNINSRNNRERAIDLLKKVGLSERINHRPNKLSGGELQRAAIARALINQPKLMLCDEPTGNLDKDNSDKIIKLLIDVSNKENTAMIIVTHDNDIARNVGKIINL